MSGDREPVVLPSLSFSYDPYSDVATIEGVRYAGDMFRDLGWRLPVGKRLRLVGRKDGTIILRTYASVRGREDI